ncbi:DUF397 domain-containing protein [Actinoallomurus purpureus]|nr:DUF397 domain-containing protein [Actinoallomurus purpureus]MCO6009409.1 DUF397 domain-containing protein [Actinoallomurus purpureus]
MITEWRKSTRSDGVEDHACVEVALMTGRCAAQGATSTTMAP